MNNRLKELRKHLNMTQTEFGEKIGRGQKAIQYYENGQRGINESLIMLISKTFNVSKEWLRTGEGEMFSPIELDIKKYLRRDDRFCGATAEYNEQIKPHERLILLRNTLKLSQAEFGDVLGKGIQDIFEYENGNINMGNLSWELLEKIDVNPFWLMLGQGEMFIGDAIDSKKRGKKSKKDIEKGSSDYFLRESSFYSLMEDAAHYGSAQPEKKQLSADKQKAINHIQNLDDADVRVVLAYIEGIAAERGKNGSKTSKNKAQ